MKSIKSKNQSKEQKVIHPIPPYNGYGSEEDSLLSVFYLNPAGKVHEYYTDKFKRDKHILRFSAKLISPVPSDEERKFIVSDYVKTSFNKFRSKKFTRKTKRCRRKPK